MPEDSVRQELNRVLASHEFHSSKRSQDFIRYVVEHALTGRADMLKERTIGIDVFGRSTSYEPSDDATVRVKAGEVRNRLGLYLCGARRQRPCADRTPGRHLRARISLDRGSRAGCPVTGNASGRANRSENRRATGRFAWVPLGIGLATVALAAIGWLFVRGRPAHYGVRSILVARAERDARRCRCARLTFLSTD